MAPEQKLILNCLQAKNKVNEQNEIRQMLHGFRKARGKERKEKGKGKSKVRLKVFA